MTNDLHSGPSIETFAAALGSIEEYDLVIIGSGEGSKYVAWTFAKQGQRVAVVERKYIGGSCPNIACLPSKNVIHSAKVASYFRRGEEFGIETSGFTVDMESVRNRKRGMVAKLVDIHVENFRKSGAELILGYGKFTGPRIVEVTLPDGTTRTLRGTNVIIGTGTTAALEPIPGLADAERTILRPLLLCPDRACRVGVPRRPTSDAATR